MRRKARWAPQICQRRADDDVESIKTLFLRSECTTKRCNFFFLQTKDDVKHSVPKNGPLTLVKKIFICLLRFRYASVFWFPNSSRTQRHYTVFSRGPSAFRMSSDLLIFSLSFSVFITFHYEVRYFNDSDFRGHANP